MRDRERVERIREALKNEGLDAILCALPSNVLLLSGYYPVAGMSVAVATAEGRVAVLAPEDELTLAQRGWADDLHGFPPHSLEKITSAAAELAAPLRDLLTKLGLAGANIGVESGEQWQTASYSALHLYGESLAMALRGAVPVATILNGQQLLQRLRAVKTSQEIGRIRAACDLAGVAFATGANALRQGLLETEVAEIFRAPLRTPAEDSEITRAEGFAWCMAGTHSSQAGAAYARSRVSRISDGDPVLVHCNSHADGYWTDISRTFCLREPDRQLRAIYEAVFCARAAALAAIKPGVAAAEVDRAAREVLRARGFDKEFKHSTGHEVGFGATDADAIPRLHPASPDVLETGMVFNVEPAIYLDELGGVRQCEMVAVTGKGYELLTNFQTGLNELVLPPSQRKAA